MSSPSAPITTTRINDGSDNLAEENAKQKRLQGQSMGTLAKFAIDAGYENNQGSLASTLIPLNPGKPLLKVLSNAPLNDNEFVESTKT